MLTHLLIILLECPTLDTKQNRDLKCVINIMFSCIINRSPDRKAKISGPHKNFAKVKTEKRQEISNKGRKAKSFFFFSTAGSMQ